MPAALIAAFGLSACWLYPSDSVVIKAGFGTLYRCQVLLENEMHMPIKLVS